MQRVANWVATISSRKDTQEPSWSRLSTKGGITCHQLSRTHLLVDNSLSEPWQSCQWRHLVRSFGWLFVSLAEPWTNLWDKPVSGGTQRGLGLCLSR